MMNKHYVHTNSIMYAIVMIGKINEHFWNARGESDGKKEKVKEEWEEMRERDTQKVRVHTYVHILS